MRRILFQIQKEFLQIKRNPLMLRIIFLLPIIQLLVLANAATFELKKVEITIVDQDKSAYSKRLINKINNTPFFKIVDVLENIKEAEKQIDNDDAFAVLVIPNRFEHKLLKENKGELQLLINAINGVKAGLSHSYLNSIIKKYNQDYLIEINPLLIKNTNQFNLTYRNWYNENEDYKIFMVPGILVILVTMLAMILSALNIVREKEIGTIEQLNVTPISKWEFIAGKLIPFWIISLFVFMLGMIFARIIFDLPIAGNLLLVFTFTNIYIITVLGFGMFISTISSTQQQAMFSSFFFMIIFILMSGLFTPIENMPDWAQQITIFNPLAYFIKFMRMVLLKGSNFYEVKDLFTSISIYALVSNLLAVLNYSKTSGENRIKILLTFFSFSFKK